jgi:ATP-dependent Clp protease protease subunit
LPHSRVMIHQPSGGAQGVATDMEINLEKCWNWKMNYTTSSHTLWTNFWQSTQRFRRDYWMKADELKNTEWLMKYWEEDKNMLKVKVLKFNALYRL